MDKKARYFKGTKSFQIINLSIEIDHFNTPSLASRSPRNQSGRQSNSLSNKGPKTAMDWPRGGIVQPVFKTKLSAWKISSTPFL